MNNERPWKYEVRFSMNMLVRMVDLAIGLNRLGDGRTDAALERRGLLKSDGTFDWSQEHQFRFAMEFAKRKGWLTGEQHAKVISIVERRRRRDDAWAFFSEGAPTGHGALASAESPPRRRRQAPSAVRT